MTTTDQGQQPSNESPVFGLPGYLVRAEPSVGGLLLVRPDGTSICIMEQSTPEGVVRRICQQDRKVQNLWREMLLVLMVDPVKYIDQQAHIMVEVSVLRYLVHGGAVAEEFGPRKGARGMGRGRG